MRKPYLERLNEGILLADGAMGTMLQTKGLPVGECPDGWNLTHPEKVQDVHRGYAEAGAESLITNTFGGTRTKLTQCGYPEKQWEINFQGATLARAIAGDAIYVVGSMGPTGQFLEPLGDLKEEVAFEDFCEQAKALEAGGADVIQIETMTDLGEICVAIRAVKQTTRLPIIASMTFDKGQQGYRTVMGVDIPTAVEKLIETGADVVGSNCGNGIDELIEIMAEMRRHTDFPLLAKPNAGIPVLESGKVVYTQGPDYFAERVQKLIDAGATIVGGCCGTTPEHIRAMARAIGRAGA
ncbi:MAG: methionine synthase [Calditrichaeota bacterium]|nr:methionine synthase [Calditrichota bacterium]